MHITTLITKNNKGSKEELTNLRPILLANTSIKLVSAVINKRLLKKCDQLIGRNQKGFLSGRQMDHNIMELNTVIESVKQHIEMYPGHYSEYAAVCLLDFTKAFDRISHTYLAEVLINCGFGPRIRRMIMLITSNQTAQLYLNNCKGRVFPSKWAPARVIHYPPPFQSCP